MGSWCRGAWTFLPARGKKSRDRGANMCICATAASVADGAGLPRTSPIPDRSAWLDALRGEGQSASGDRRAARAAAARRAFRGRPPAPSGCTAGTATTSTTSPCRAPTTRSSPCWPSSTTSRAAAASRPGPTSSCCSRRRSSCAAAHGRAASWRWSPSSWPLHADGRASPHDDAERAELLDAVRRAIADRTDAPPARGARRGRAQRRADRRAGRAPGRRPAARCTRRSTTRADRCAAACGPPATPCPRKETRDDTTRRAAAPACWAPTAPS